MLFRTKPELNKVKTFSIQLKGQGAERATLKKFTYLYLGVIFDQGMT